MEIWKFIQHLIVGLMSEKDSKKDLGKDTEKKVMKDQTIEDILERINPTKVSDLLTSTPKMIISFSRRYFGVFP